MIPAWKVRREMCRIGRQVFNLHAQVATLPARFREPALRDLHDQNFDQTVKVIIGEVPLGKKPAIYLIYQPEGISASTILTVCWLRSHGYSPVVVANSPLGSKDISCLREYAALVVQRPNFGYDFGGYRDALRLLDREGLDAERLIIMNDSVWMPFTSDALKATEGLEDADVIGLLQDEKVIHDHLGGTPSQKRHIESYFYAFNRTALQSDTFKNFWREYRMTDYKPNTIKFGELGLSRKMAAAGLRLAALTKRSVFLEQLAQRHDDDIALTLRYAAYGDADLRREGDLLRGMPRSSPGWRLAVLEHIRKSVNRKRFNASFCYANEQIFGTFFMKKSSEEVFSQQRLQYLRAVRDGVLASPPVEILREVEAVVNLEHPSYRSEQPQSRTL